MTDKEIIKALECCFNNEENCDNCPQHSRTCIDDLLKSSLDLIKQQQAEIQALREDIHNRKARENKLRSKIKSFKSEIEKLKGGVDNG